MPLPKFVGRYEIRNEIGKGGFAVVVQAWDEELESFVALKILHRELVYQEEVERRFLEEARLLRRIRSPNVITVHDVGRLNDGQPYFVMDLADRGSLEARVENSSHGGPADSQSLLTLVDGLADGLTALHEAGVIHRDIKPANILFQLARRAPIGPARGEAGHQEVALPLVDSGERILIGDLGIAKDLVKRDEQVTMIGGTLFYQAPEQTQGDVEITSATDIYAATALLWHVLSGRRPPLPHDVADKLGILPTAWHDVIQRGMSIDPDDRFGSMNHWRSAIYDTLAHDATLTQTILPSELDNDDSSCPFKGLAAYQVADADCFFGREVLIEDLVRRMQLQKVLVVGGPSGSGKSSLVRAGLIPALNAGALPGSDRWSIALFTPGRDPLAELHFQVSRFAPDAKPTVSLGDLTERPSLARHLAEPVGSGNSLVLCIDQFEELFVLASEAQRIPFVAALSAMSDPADSRVRIVITVRADFYATCAQVPWLAERITANQVLVGPMTGSELRRAVGEPARRFGLNLERNLVDVIVDEAGEEAGSLPLLAHALVETWKRRRGRTLMLEGFRDAGGVAGAISQTADVTFESRFNDAERDATKRLFLRLVTPGEGTSDARRALPRSEIENDADPEVMGRVVESLTEARLLIVDDATVQIAHEALLRTWPRLHGWIEESRDDLRTRQRIVRVAAEWDDGNRDPDLLYRGTPLLSALEWVNKHPDLLGASERAFLDASTEAKERAEAIAEERWRRAQRIRRAVIAGLSFLATGATVASVIAFLGFRDARDNEQRAEQATAEARERFAGALGAAASGLAESDPLLALVLAAEAVARAESAPPGYDARATMVAARNRLTQRGPFLFGSPVAAGDALSIAVSPDGSLVATALRDGNIDIIDARTQRKVGPSLRGHRVGSGIWTLGHMGGLWHRLGPTEPSGCGNWAVVWPGRAG